MVVPAGTTVHVLLTSHHRLLSLLLHFKHMWCRVHEDGHTGVVHLSFFVRHTRFLCSTLCSKCKLLEFHQGHLVFPVSLSETIEDFASVVSLVPNHLNY